MEARGTHFEIEIVVLGRLLVATAHVVTTDQYVLWIKATKAGFCLCRGAIQYQ